MDRSEAERRDFQAKQAEIYDAVQGRAMGSVPHIKL
jgi:hypothetical protein